MVYRIPKCERNKVDYMGIKAGENIDRSMRNECPKKMFENNCIEPIKINVKCKILIYNYFLTNRLC